MSVDDNDKALEVAQVLTSICRSNDDVINAKSLPSSTSSVSTKDDKEKEFVTKAYDNIRILSFPQALMEVISDNSFPECIKWVPEGFAFMLKNDGKSDKKIASCLQIGDKRIESEIRRWGFKIIAKGPTHNVYFHKLFHRDMPFLCNKMKISRSIRRTERMNLRLTHANQLNKKEAEDNSSALKAVLNNLDMNQDFPCKIRNLENVTSLCQAFNHPRFGTNGLAFMNMQEDCNLNNSQTSRKLFEICRRHIYNEILLDTDLKEMQRTFYNFRHHHHYVISRSMDALFNQYGF